MGKCVKLEALDNSLPLLRIWKSRLLWTSEWYRLLSTSIRSTREGGRVQQR